jgi:hypothetical protein
VTPGLRLALAWVARVVAWVLIAYGVALVVWGAWIFGQYQIAVIALLVLLLGGGAIRLGRFVEARAAGVIRGGRPEARGFDVIGPTPRP